MLLNVRIYRKLVSITDKYCAKVYQKMLKNTDFTIICNNCWGGYVYRKFALPYLTPTVGLYFFPDDYIKLCKNLSYYMNARLEFIKAEDSNYKDIIFERNQENVPIGKIYDIEIIFLHYKSQEEAREKWERRKKRINYDNLIFKFSKMDGCTEENLKEFDAIKCDKKICFIPPRDKNLIDSAVVFKSAKGNDIICDDTSEYGRYINLVKLVNSKKVNGTNFEK